MIYEQFSSFREMILIVWCISAVAIFSALVSIHLRERYVARIIHQESFIGKTILLTFGFISGMVGFISGSYWVIYYINVHYLIVIHL